MQVCLALFLFAESLSRNSLAMRSYLRATDKPAIKSLNYWEFFVWFCGFWLFFFPSLPPLNTGLSLPSPVPALSTEVSAVNLGGKDSGCFMKSTLLFLDVFCDCVIPTI